MTIRSLLSATIALVFAACSGGTGGLGEPRFVDCPAAPDSQAPNLAVGLDGELYLSWVEPRENGHAFRFSIWRAGQWSTPRTVAEGDDWFVNWADFPSMAALEDGTLAAHWLVRSGSGTYAYDVNLSLSHDGGATWGEPFRPHDDGTETEHGFVSLVAAPEGRFEILWLDGRQMADTPSGPMTLRHATLDPDGRLTSGGVVDDRVCDCCSTDALRAGDGATLVAYRDRSDSEVRDISVARLDGSTWSSALSVHADGWEIPACPVNGPAVEGSGNVMAVAWFSAARETPVVQVAFSTDGGRSFDAPVRVDHGSPLGRVDLAFADDGWALVSWLEQEGERATIFLRPVRASGALESIPIATTDAARSSGFPRMARLGDEIVLAWTEPGEPSRIRTAVLSLLPS